MPDCTPLAARFRPLPLLVGIPLLCLATAELRAAPVPGDPLTGSGEVDRTLLVADDLLAGTPLSGPLDESAFALPAEAAYPQHRFNGRLELLGEEASDNISARLDRFGRSANPWNRRLPEIDHAFVQHGSHLIPARRGLIITPHPSWNLILEPGRVWRENGDGDMSRAAFPFALVEKNQNCVHNGIMSFLFDEEGISRVWYQITLETCYYFQIDLWGMLDAVYHPEPVPNQARLREGYVDEVAQRFPTRPIAQLAVDYPELDAEALHRDLTPEGLTTYGLVVDGIHYAAPCRSRYGDYAFCSQLRMPSYSTAKSAFASVALMRLAQKYGPWVEDLRISDWVPEHTRSPGDWSAVTFGDAIDMATGHFVSSEPFADDEGPPVQNMAHAFTYADKIAAAFDAPYRTPPGTLWVYRSNDTFIVTRAMQNFLRHHEGEDADLFRMVVEEVYKPIGIGPGAHTTLRTSDHNWQGEPFGYMGLFWIQDDIAKLTTFLNVDGGRAAGRQLLHPDLLAAGLQRNPADRGLLAGAAWQRYNNSFFAVRYTPADLPVERGTFWAPFMMGYGGIIFAMLPYGISYYYFSDYDEFSVRPARAIMTAFGGYRASELPALTTAAGELAAITAVAINNRGQVIGRAASSEADDPRFGAFRYTPGVGIEDLDPSGEYRSAAVAINDASEVFGLTFADSPGGARQNGLFLYRDATGFDFLETGSNRTIRETFALYDLNEAGDLVGAVDRRQDPQRVPYLYDPDDGWLALLGLDPRLRERPTPAVAINDAGEIVFTTEPRPSGAQGTYVLLRSGRLLRLGNFGRRVNVPAALNDAGRVVGFSETAAGERHAYVFTSGAGLVDLHRRFAESVAGWVTSQGVVGGVFLNPEPETLFTWDETRSPNLRLEARRADFQALLAEGTVFERLEVVAMNERLEFVGRVEGRDGDESVSRFFHCAPATGVRDLQVLLDETGSERQVTAVVDLNDRGAVLLQVGAGAVVLSPRSQ